MRTQLTRALGLSVAALFAVGCSDTTPTEPGAEAPPEVALFAGFDLNDCDFVVEDGESIQAAIDDAAEGQTVCVEAGAYQEPLTGFKDGLALRGAGSGAVTIDVSGSGTNRGINVGNNLKNVTLEGFTVTNSDSGDFGLKIQFVDGLVVRDVVALDNGRTGIDLNGVSNARLIDVRALGNAGAGVALRDSDGIQAHGIRTSGNAWGGLALWAVNEEVLADVAITGSEFSSEPVGVFVQHTGAFEGVTLEDNAFRDNEVGFVIDDAFGAPDAAAFTLNFNNFEGNEAFGVLNAGEGVLDATHNWWGHPGGPQRPAGQNDRFSGPRQADRVSQGVDFHPWLNDAFAWQLSHEPGLALWLDASAIEGADGRPVGTWQDQSGLGNHAQQDDTDRQPTFVADGLNELPAVRFDGTSHWLDAGGEIEPATITVAAVFQPRDWTADFQRLITRRDASATEGYILSFGAGTDRTRIRSIVATEADGFIRAEGSHLDPGEAQIVVMKWDGSTLNQYLNGALDASATGDGDIDYVESAMSLGIGGHPGDAPLFDGMIAEVVIFDRALSGVDRERIERYLSEKYDIGLR